MQWTKPTWPITFDLVAYGIAFVVVLIAGGVWRLLGW